MPDVVSNEELNALAAEYVLGTLDYEERKGASALLEVDPTFREIVRIWERRFGELHLMVESVEPDPQLWARIKPKVPGLEQVPPAIPSAADALAAAIATVNAPAAPVAETAAPEPKADDATTTVATAPAASEAPPAEPKPDAVAETELKLAELAALLPVAGAPEAQQSGAEQPGPAPEDALPPRAAEEIPRGFVPPVPMSTRGAPIVVEKPVTKTGRGWMAATLAMGLVAVVLAGLISAWRFFPDRLPAQLRAYSVLNLMPPPPPPSPPQKARPKLPAFDE